jgi:hypothetical protein
MTISRKIFAANVALAADAATSLYQLMKASALHWGYEDATLTQPSMDSILGSNTEFTPSGPVYVGSDSNVRNAALGGSTYRGVLAPGGDVFSLQDFGPVGMIDPNQIWLYAQSGATLDVTFQAR